MLSFFSTGFFTSNNTLCTSAYDLLSKKSKDIEHEILKDIGWGSCRCINPFGWLLGCKVRAAVKEALAAHKWDEAMALKGRTSIQPRHLSEKEETAIPRIQLSVLQSGATLQDKAAAWKSCSKKIQQLNPAAPPKEMIDFLKAPGDVTAGLAEELNMCDDPLSANIDRLPKTTLGTHPPFLSSDKEKLLKAIQTFSEQMDLSSEEHLTLEKLIGQSAKNRIATQLLLASLSKLPQNWTLTVDSKNTREQAIVHLMERRIRISYSFNLELTDLSKGIIYPYAAAVAFDWVRTDHGSGFFENGSWILAE